LAVCNLVGGGFCKTLVFSVSAILLVTRTGENPAALYARSDQPGQLCFSVRLSLAFCFACHVSTSVRAWHDGDHLLHLEGRA
jgi:hypothetical protein